MIVSVTQLSQGLDASICKNKNKKNKKKINQILFYLRSHSRFFFEPAAQIKNTLKNVQLRRTIHSMKSLNQLPCSTLKQRKYHHLILLIIQNNFTDVQAFSNNNCYLSTPALFIIDEKVNNVGFLLNLLVESVTEMAPLILS